MVVLLMSLLMAASIPPRNTLAQDAADLVVSVLDENNNAVSATITVRDTAGERDFARTTTDAQGLATVAVLPINEVRVVVEGFLRDGTRLFQRGDDAAGIYVLLEAGSTRLDLRVDPDGAVIPDPATMVAQEGFAADVAALPTAPLSAQAAASPTSTPPAVRQPSALAQQSVSASNQQPANTGMSIGSIALVALLVFGIAGVLLLRRAV
jgi:hypothetical protein